MFLSFLKYNIHPAGYTSHKTHNDESTKDSSLTDTSNNPATKCQAIRPSHVILGLTAVLIIALAIYYLNAYKNACGPFAVKTSTIAINKQPVLAIHKNPTLSSRTR